MNARLILVEKKVEQIGKKYIIQEIYSTPAGRIQKMTEIEKNKIQVLIKIGYNLSDLKVSNLVSEVLFCRGAFDWGAICYIYIKT